MGMITDWPSLAACQNGDPDALFVQGAEQNVAKRICRQCPVRYECLADALDNRIEFGVWGGMTERERRALLRSKPGVTSWRRMFEAAMKKEGQRKVEAVLSAEASKAVGATALAGEAAGESESSFESAQPAIPAQRSGEEASQPNAPRPLLQDHTVSIN